MITIFFALLLLLSSLLAFVLMTSRIKLSKGIQRMVEEDAAFTPPVLNTDHAVDTLKVTPLVDYYADNADLQTEAGVSWLVEAGEYRILMDLGANEKKAHPSPLLFNAEKLGVDLTTLNSLFLSHLHRDHVGGVGEEKSGSFAFSKGPFSCDGLRVYTPEPLQGELPSGCDAVTVTEPHEIAPGIWSMGPMGRSLFLMGYTIEQVLAVHVKGKGMALIIGCGHPGIERILERCKALFPHPVFAVIGGLHYPIHGGRMMLGPVNLQKLVGADRMPWNGLNDADVKEGIDAIAESGANAVGLSPHDSCDATLDRFRGVFGEKYEEIRVGRPVVLA